MSQDSYFKIGRASDLKDSKERLIYRALEIFPGLFSLSTLLGAVLISKFFPVQAAFLFIAFVFYWLLRTIYLFLYLRAGYKKMQEYEKIDWIQKLDNLPKSKYSLPVLSWRDIYHLVLIPTFKEPVEVLYQTLLSIKFSDYPKDRIIVVLGIEKSQGREGEVKASVLQKEFQSEFFRFLVTFHPQGLPGEIPGKGSNETWAARQAFETIIQRLGIKIENVLVSSFDADTVVFPGYFSCLTYHFLTTPDPLHTSFQPVPLFLNNIWEAPAISRVFAFSTTFWHTINQERPEQLITFSSHAMSLRALIDAGFKQTNVVSDDSHIFWQCFFRYDGNYKVQPVFYPVSMDANVGPTFLKTLLSIYKQQRRWAYGVGEIPYFLFGFLKNKKIPLTKKLSLGFELIEGHWSWATAPILLFLAGWLPLLLGGEAFNKTLLAYNLPTLTSRILTFAMLGLIGSAVISINLLPPKKPNFGRWRILLFGLQWILFPFMMIFFAALPALDAQLRWMLGRYMGFWHTLKIRKNV